MASTPMKRAMEAAIRDCGGIDYVLERIEAGETIGQIAASFGVGRPMLARYLHSKPEWSARTNAAKKARADTWAEETLTISDRDETDPGAIRRDQLRVETRFKLAAAEAPEKYSLRAAAGQTNVTIGSLHIGALRRLQAEVGDQVDGEAVEVGGHVEQVREGNVD